MSVCLFVGEFCVSSLTLNLTDENNNSNNDIDSDISAIIAVVVVDNTSVKE